MKSAFLFYMLPIFLIGLLSFSDICQKLSADVKQREWLVACCTHKVCIQSNPAPQATCKELVVACRRWLLNSMVELEVFCNGKN